ncbi:ferredoxin [Candidatus Woesearchaeota archaeon]|nr:ferredoxin [Candidatus Woesearchaeota archaeon]
MKLILEQDKCIGCGACTNICPKHFKMRGIKSELIGGKKTKDGFEKEIGEVDKDVKDAVNSCPAMCILVK